MGALGTAMHQAGDSADVTGAGPWGALSAVAVLAATLRLTGLGERTLSWDELAMWHAAHGVSAGPQEAPLMPWLAGLLMAAIGDASPAVLLAVPVAAGVAVVPAMFGVGRALGDTRLGLMVALLAAVSPFAVGYSQLARSYALLHLATALLLWTLIRATQSERLVDWAKYGGATAMACLANLLAAQVLLAVLLYAMGSALWRRSTGEAARLAGVTVLAAAAGSAWVFGRQRVITVLEGAHPLGLVDYVRVAIASLGTAMPLHEASQQWPLWTLALWPALLAALGFAALWMRTRRAAVLLALLIAVPMVLTYTQLGPKGTWPGWSRYLTPVLVPWLVLVAQGALSLVDRLGPRLGWPLAAATVATSAPGLWGWYGSAADLAGPYARSVALVAERSPPVTGVLFVERESRYADETQRLLTAWRLYGDSTVRGAVVGGGRALATERYDSWLGLPDQWIPGEAEVTIRSGIYGVIARSAAVECRPLQKVTELSVELMEQRGTAAICRVSRRP